jgi:hypothetical protein
MKRVIVLAAIAALAVPGSALAKGPDEAKIEGPGLGKAITITGPEQEGSPMMDFAEATGFFPAAFGQTPDPMMPARPKGDLGPKYRIEYNVPAGEGKSSQVSQDLYPYAKPDAVTYMASGQSIFDFTTRGGWYSDPRLKALLVSYGLPTTASAAKAKSSNTAGFFSTGRLGALVFVLLLVAGATVLMRRRFRGDAPA